MLIKKFIGPDKAKVIERIRREFGDDAIILHVTHHEPSGVFKFMSRARWEILAGQGFKIVRSASPEGKPTTTFLAKKLTESYDAEPPKKRDEHEAQMEGVKAMLRQIEKKITLNGSYSESVQALSERVSGALAQRFVDQLLEKSPPEKVKDAKFCAEAVRAIVRDMIRCCDGIDFHEKACVRVAFVGPTGVGKTTTIAKVAAVYSQKYGRRVAVVTNDTYRIAATEQLKRVCELIGVPIKVAATPDEVRAACDSLADAELLLVDTAGRSQRNFPKMKELKLVVEAVKPDEVHLVLSANLAGETLAQIANHFSVIGFSKIVLTKLDEAVKVGLVLDTLSQIQAKISFITTGQRIPQDIEIADRDRIVGLIFGEEHIAS